MTATLAIDGGPRALPQMTVNTVPPWPPVYPEVPAMLERIYCSRRWSFNETIEQEFSRAFAAHHSAARGIMMANGTVTLECALRALGVGPGDEVIVPALTWMATAMAAVYVGATPVFVDIEPDTLCLDPEKVKAAITPRTKAIIPVHIYGSMADMEAIMDIATAKDIAVIEDCAHAHGGVWNGRGVGSIGRVGSFSFQQSKTLPSGEGGMCITNDVDLTEKLFRLKHIGYMAGVDQGQAAEGPPEGLICRNYRATEFQAAILLAGLKRLGQNVTTCDANRADLAAQLADVDGVEIQARGRLADLQGYYMLFFLVDLKKFNNISLDRFIEIARAEGLGLGKTYGPVYDHKLWNVPSGMFKKAAGGCGVADDVCANVAVGLSLSWALAGKDVIDGIAATFKKIAANADKLA